MKAELLELPALRHSGIGTPRYTGIGTIHRIRSARVRWNDDRTHGIIAAKWECTGGSANADLLAPDTAPTCIWCQASARAAIVGCPVGTPAIYYCKWKGRSPIKIGLSTSVGQRMASMSGVLLAVEPLRLKITEKARHRQFEHLSAGSEWFKRGPDLLAHIKQLQLIEDAAWLRSDDTGSAA